VYNLLFSALLNPFIQGNTVIESRGLDLIFSLSSWRNLPETGDLVRHAISMEFHSASMAYGSVLGFVVLMWLPGLSIRNRVSLQLGLVSLTFLTHVIGILILAGSLESMTLGSSSKQEFETIERILTLTWLAIPSLIWLPAMIRTSFSGLSIAGK
jgi:hypothetical protein